MRKRSERGRGRPPKITRAIESAIYHARELGVAWKDLCAQYDCSRSVAAAAFARARARFSGHRAA